MLSAHVQVYALPVLPETHISFVLQGVVWLTLPQQPPEPCTAQVLCYSHEKELLPVRQQSGQAASPSALTRQPYAQVASGYSSPLKVVAGGDSPDVVGRPSAGGGGAGPDVRAAADAACSSSWSTASAARTARAGMATKRDIAGCLWAICRLSAGCLLAPTWQAVWVRRAMWVKAACVGGGCRPALG